jgi:hypothetical protein
MVMINVLRWFQHTPPQAVAASLRRTGLFALIFFVLLLTVTGRLPLLLTLVGALMTFAFRFVHLLRFIPVLRQLCVQLGIPWPPTGGWGGGAGPGPFGPGTSSDQSTVQSRFVRMSLDHRSGELRGEVLEGRFARRWLNELSLDDLLRLLAECRVDPESANLVEAYLDRVHGPDWRSKAQGSQGGGQRQSASSGKMSAEEAYQVLGLKAGAGKQEVIEAHRRLMLKVHPDRGGSDYLAAKLNQAKDVLLG